MGLFDIRAAVRGGLSGSTPAILQANEKSELFMAQGLPPFTEMARKGQYYGTMSVSAVAALVVRPTTLCILEIYNNSMNTGLGAQNMLISTMFAHELVHSTTGLGGGSSLYAMVTLPKAAPSDGALVIASLTGRPPATKSVITGIATSGLTDNGWFPWGTANKTESAGAVVPAGHVFAAVDGKILVPPSCSLCLSVVSGYAADTFTPGATWWWEALSTIQ